MASATSSEYSVPFISMEFDLPHNEKAANLDKKTSGVALAALILIALVSSVAFMLAVAFTIAGALSITTLLPVFCVSPAVFAIAVILMNVPMEKAPIDLCFPSPPDTSTLESYDNLFTEDARLAKKQLEGIEIEFPRADAPEEQLLNEYRLQRIELIADYFDMEKRSGLKPAGISELYVKSINEIRKELEDRLNNR